jgi:hypothetical protein
MTAGVVGFRSRKRKEEAKRAAKAKKEKILLAVCGVVLVGLVALEGPKTLKKLHGSSGAAPAAVTPSPSAGATGSQTASSAATAADLEATKHLASKDPFVTQLGTEAAAAQEVAPVTGPAVRASRFVKKDPFIQQLTFAAPTASSAAPAPTTPTPTPGSTTVKAAGGKTEDGSGNYIVMVASIPISDGRDVARATAATARSQGVPSVKIVDSSRYPTLRTGFYAVYSGPYPTLADLLPALEQVRGKGYPSAYTRRLAH